MDSKAKYLALGSVLTATVGMVLFGSFVMIREFGRSINEPLSISENQIDWVRRMHADAFGEMPQTGRFIRVNLDYNTFLYEIDPGSCEFAALPEAGYVRAVIAGRTDGGAAKAAIGRTPSKCIMLLQIHSTGAGTHSEKVFEEFAQQLMVVVIRSREDSNLN